jgi:hypothetical protein
MHFFGCYRSSPTLSQDQFGLNSSKLRPAPDSLVDPCTIAPEVFFATNKNDTKENELWLSFPRAWSAQYLNIMRLKNYEDVAYVVEQPFTAGRSCPGERAVKAFRNWAISRCLPAIRL